MKRPMSSIRLYMSVCISCCWTGFRGFSSKPCSVILIAKAQARWAPPALTSVSCMHERRSNCLLYWTTLHWSKPYPDQDRLRMLASYTCKTRQQVRFGWWHTLDAAVYCEQLAFDCRYPIACSDCTCGYAQVADWFTNWRARVWKHQLLGVPPVDQPSLWQRTRCKLLALVAFLEIYDYVKIDSHTKHTASISLKSSLRVSVH